MLSKQWTNGLPEEKVKADPCAHADLIAKDICKFGGNSFINWIRDSAPAYKEIVCDVAGKLRAPYNSGSSIESIEDSIVATILEKALEKMSENEKRELLKELGDKRSNSLAGPALTMAIMTLFRAGGFLSYQILVIVVSAITKAVLGHGIKMAVVTKGASILVGPIGWIIAGIWAAIDIAGPAYRVTTPAVVYIAMLRRKQNMPSCPHCKQMIPCGVKFCPECGKEI